ncbi:MAG: Holliday junction branch migration protein RuvA [Geminicoccaceae bacterium]
MIALLRGRIAEIGEDHVIVDAGGVGYLVHCPSRTLHRLPSTGGEVELRIVTQVREDAITLYGFNDPAEQRWFRILQNIQGVGARLALAILSVSGPDELVQAIAAQDRVPLTRANGVGPKVAGRIVSELKDKIGSLPAAGGGAVESPAAPATASGAAGDALAALASLGYGRSEAFSALSRVQARLGGEATLDALIRESLKELSP